MTRLKWSLVLLALVLLFACGHEDDVVLPNPIPLGSPVPGPSVLTSCPPETETVTVTNFHTGACTKHQLPNVCIYHLGTFCVRITRREP